MSKTITIIGPADHGRKMSLQEFDHAEGKEGHLYELSRGFVIVVDVPGPLHLRLVDTLRRRLAKYREVRPEVIWGIAGGGECKILIEALESERHPDLAVYKTPPPEADSDDEVWSQWVPEIVIEVVSPSSRVRDHEEKPEEYLQFGVSEYWIVDAEQGVMKVMRRSRGRWAELAVRPPDAYRTRLLPGLEFSIAALFGAAGDR